MDMAQRQPNNRRASIRLLSSKLVIQLIVLQKLVSQAAHMQSCCECCFDLDILQLVIVPLEQLIDLLLMLFKVRIREFGVIWDLRIVDFRVDELDDAVDKVAEVLQQFVVVRCDEAVPLKFGVAGLGSVGEEVVSPDI